VISLSQNPLPYNTQHSQKTGIHVPYGIQTPSLNNRAAADLRLKPRATGTGNHKTLVTSNMMLNILIYIYIYISGRKNYFLFQLQRKL